MPISFQCEVCYKRYNAPDQMAGKRIKCKACGTIIYVPATATDGSDVLELVELEPAPRQSPPPPPPKPHRPAPAGPAAKAPAATTPSRTTRTPDTKAHHPTTANESLSLRPNNPLDYPLAGVVDVALPLFLILGGAIWVLGETCSANTTGQRWLPLIRAGIYLLAFFFVVTPVVSRWIGWPAVKFGFMLPPSRRRRVAAILSPPFVLGYVLWLVGGHFSDWVIGSVLGLFLMSVLVWLLLRLDMRETIPTYIVMVMSYILSAAIVAGLFIGLNMLMIKVISMPGQSSELKGSPFGETFPWAVTKTPAATQPAAK